MENKVVFIDWGVYCFRSIFGWLRNANKQIPPTYTCLSMLIGDLKKIGISPDDLLILACDSPLGSWRRTIDQNYKVTRKANREKYKEINWPEQFAKFDSLKENLYISTPFHIMEADKMEADDFISYGVRYFLCKECIILSSDTDFEQLAIFPNVKLFSPISKKYKIVKSPEKILQKKIKIERTDNLITPIENNEDYLKRKTIVDLTTLPKNIEDKLEEEFKNIDYDKDFDLENAYSKIIKDKFMEIYNSDKIVKEKSEKKKHKKRRKKRDNKSIT